MIGLLASVPRAPAPISWEAVEVQMIKTVIVVAFLLVGFRLLGKREMSQLSVYDLAMLFAISNAVQNAMTAGKGNLVVGLAVSATVVMCAWLLTKAMAGRPRLEARIVGSPTILVHNGTVLVARMRRQRINDEELAAACRAHGLEDSSDVALAVLEVDGSISVVPRS